MVLSLPLLIAFSGLPGTGKSTIARRLVLRLGAVYLRIDSIEQALARSSLRIQPAADAGYTAAFAVASDNLQDQAIVVADSVNPVEASRDAWRQIAKNARAALFEVEIVCSDADEHRRRVENRATDIEGLRLPTWEQVQRREYEPWTRHRCVLDTATMSVAACVDQLLASLPEG